MMISPINFRASASNVELTKPVETEAPKTETVTTPIETATSFKGANALAAYNKAFLAVDNTTEEAPKAPAFKGEEVETEEVPKAFKGEEVETEEAPKAPAFKGEEIETEEAPKAPAFKGEEVETEETPKAPAFKGEEVETKEAPVEAGDKVAKEEV